MSRSSAIRGSPTAVPSRCPRSRRSRAGLPIFPAVVRYDELQRGMVEHAMRVTVKKSRRAYVYPARHFASKYTDEDLPRMGERLRLRKDVDISGFTPHVQAILKGLQKY